MRSGLRKRAAAKFAAAAGAAVGAAGDAAGASGAFWCWFCPDCWVGSCAGHLRWPWPALCESQPCVRFTPLCVIGAASLEDSVGSGSVSTVLGVERVDSGVVQAGSAGGRAGGHWWRFCERALLAALRAGTAGDCAGGRRLGSGEQTQSRAVGAGSFGRRDSGRRCRCCGRSELCEARMYGDGSGGGRRRAGFRRHACSPGLTRSSCKIICDALHEAPSARTVRTEAWNGIPPLQLRQQSMQTSTALSLQAARSTRETL